METEVKKQVRYFSTNESLGAIINGLDIKNTDNILAIGGSGDQAFAMLEYCKKVFVVDINEDQLYFIRQRVEYLKEGNINEFLTPGDFVDVFPMFTKERNNYFKHQNRLDKIKQKTDNLEILSTEKIEELNSKTLFDKIYLSNALNSSSPSLKRELKGISKNLKSGGLIYMVDYEENIKKIMSKKNFIFNKFPHGLKIEENLTDSATKVQCPDMFNYNWVPIVFKKAKKQWLKI
ncbi:MAG: class I SAM-dependent methyltransferase [Candidatus Pacearchaeota archaeon]|jgi:SAM-dependent methyltransferase